MQKVILKGNTTADPEIRAVVKTGDSMARFTLACNKNNEAIFLACTAFGAQADFIEKYVKKGDALLVIGDIYPNNWKKKDGTEVKEFGVTVREIEFAQRKS